MSVTAVIWSLIIGFVIGLVARAIVPGADHYGLLATCLLGIVGSWIGGFLGGLVSRPPEGATFHPAGFIGSVIGAIVLLLGLRLL